MRFLLKILLGFFLISSLLACRKEYGKASWDVSVLTPLINTSLGINNLIADSLLQTNPDTSIKIVYNNTLYNFSTDSLVNIPDTITQQVFHIPINITAPPGQMILNKTDNKQLDLGDAKITKIIVKSGYINLKMKNTLKEKMLCTYQIPCATLNGIPFEVTDLIPAADVTGSVNFSKKVDISGYTFNLTGQNGNSANTLTSITKAWVNPNGNPVYITNLDSLQIFAGFEDIIIDYAKGYFGSKIFQSGQQFAAFDLFKKITSGSLSLEDIHLVLSVSNGFGVDAGLLIHEIKSVNNRTNTTVSLVSSIISSSININRAQETNNPSSPVIPSVFLSNLDNSNFRQLIENLPDQMEFSLDITTDPLGNISCGNDFIHNKYGFKADLDLEIPLSLIAHELTLTDTIDFNLSKPDGYKINHGVLTLIADNGFPFTAATQLFLLDNNSALTDSLMPFSNIIDSAPLDANDKVISKKRNTIKIPVTGEKLDHLYNAKKIIIVVSFNTALQGHYIKIYSDYSLDMKLTGDFDMTVNQK